MGELTALLADAARGVFPPPDGGTTVLSPASPRDTAVLALTAHAVVVTREDPEWVRATLAALPGDPLGAVLSPGFLTALADRTGLAPGSVDLLTVAHALPGPPGIPLREVADPSHPRVARARLHRDAVRVRSADEGLLVLGRGVAGRWEAAVEVGPAARGRGAGRRLARAARHLVPDGEVVWAQQAVGNAASVRAFQAAGYRPVGAEVLFSATGT